jgi:UDPglucose 6-dehydrogenase
LVFGVASGQARALLDACYAPVIADGTPVVETDLATAELVKAAANSFLATKISYINAMAEVCEVTGADVNQLARHSRTTTGSVAVSSHPASASRRLPAQGHPRVHPPGRELGVGQAVGFLQEVDAINQRRRQRTVDLITEMACGDLAGVHVTVLGAAFKTQLRRHPRRPRPGRGPNAPPGRRQSDRLRPQSHGQTPDAVTPSSPTRTASKLR